MLSPEDVRALDLNSAWHGVSTHALMHNAGRAVAEVATKRYAPRHALVLAGLSNNGGDGAVAARLLAEAGVAVSVLYAGDPAEIRTEEARAAFAAIDGRQVRVERWRGAERAKELLHDADLVIDALLGVGAEGDLREPVRTLVRLANASRRRILAVDVPTGLGGRLQVRPDATVTLHDRKRGMTPATCGSIQVRDIGIPEAAHDAGPGDLAVHFPRHAVGSHKGDNGRLVVFAGGPYSGAALLASLAALRTGVDLVVLVTPEDVAEAARVASPDLVVVQASEDDHLVPQDLKIAERHLARASAVLAGPGLGTHRDTQAFLGALLGHPRAKKLPLVLDADAHAVARRHIPFAPRRPVLVTPHAREFRDLTGKALPKDLPKKRRVAEAQARRIGATILLKGPTDVITDGRVTKLNQVHHPWMTVGGTGDVLAGLCGGFVAQGLSPVRAATAAAFLNGAAGRKAFERTSWSTRATDLLEAIPDVLRDWIRE